MKEALNSVFFLLNFVPFYTLLLLSVTRIVFSYVFPVQYMRKEGKRWLVYFPIFIAVTLGPIHILITPARKLRYARKLKARKLFELR